MWCVTAPLIPICGELRSSGRLAENRGRTDTEIGPPGGDVRCRMTGRRLGPKSRMERGKMRIERHYTNEGQSPYEAVPFRTATSEIRNPDGSIVFRLDDIQVPAAWSQVATDVLAQKYFRKAGVPARLKRIEENSVPSFLWRSEADTRALAALPEAERFGSETRRARRSSTGSPAPGPIGAGRAATSPPRRTRAPSSTSSATCWRRRRRRRTRRNGSTPACTGPTASKGRARATTTSTIGRRSW